MEGKVSIRSHRAARGALERVFGRRWLCLTWEGSHG